MTRTETLHRGLPGGAEPVADAVIVGIPFDLGGPYRGCSLAPQAIRFAGLIDRLEKQGLKVQDAGDVALEVISALYSDRLRNLPAVVAANAVAYEAARDAVERGRIGVFLGGDHSIAIGTIAGVAAQIASTGGALGLIWFDAHGDFNTAQTTRSGHIHGMPFAASVGYGAPELTHLGGFVPKIRPENAVLVGARDVDPEEHALLAASGVKVFTMRDVQERGIGAIVEVAIAIASRGTAGIHLSFDMDVLDPHEAPGVGSPVNEGMTAREARQAFAQIGETGLLRSIDMVEVNPLLDVRNESARIAVELIAAAFSCQRVHE